MTSIEDASDNLPIVLRLSALKPMECGVITELGQGSTSSRLQAMGICLGRRVEVVKNGDPLILKVYGTRIGLSGRMADEIEVEVCEAGGRCWERAQQHG